MAHAVGVSVEGELGCLGSLETGEEDGVGAAGKLTHDRLLAAEERSGFDPRKALIAAKKAARGLCEARFEAFGCAGQAARIRPVPLEAMVPRYA